MATETVVETKTPAIEKPQPLAVRPIDDPRFNALINASNAREVRRTNPDGTEAVPFFVMDGVKEQDTGVKKVPIIYVNCEVGPKDFKKSRSFPLHEIPLVRRLHAAQAGDLVIFTTGYAPGLKQVKWLSQMEVQDEYRRLHGDTQPESPCPPMYILPATGQGTEPKNIFLDVYGAGRDGMERFFKALRDMALAWMDLVQASERGKVITPEDVWNIIEIADPRLAMSTIEMPDFPSMPDLASAMTAPPPPAHGARPESPGLKNMHPKTPMGGPKGQAPAAAGATSSPASSAADPDAVMETSLTAFLKTEDVPEPIAKAFAAEVRLSKGQPITEDGWVRALGKQAKSPEARTTLTTHLDHFLNPGTP